MPRKKGVPSKRDVRKNKVGRPTIYKPEYPEMLLDHMAGGESFPSFAAIIRTHWDCLYEWCDPKNGCYHPEFAEAKRIGEALLLRHDEQLGKSGMTGNLRRIAAEIDFADGTKKTEYAAATFAQTAWIFLMKNRFPGLYKDRMENALMDPDGKPLEGVQVNVMIPSNGRETHQKLAEDDL